MNVRHIYVFECINRELNDVTIGLKASNIKFNILAFQLVNICNTFTYGYIRINAKGAKFSHSMYVNGATRSAWQEALPFHREPNGNMKLHVSEFTLKDKSSTQVSVDILDCNMKVMDDAKFLLTLSAIPLCLPGENCTL
jgi:hypothetical protein